MRDFDADRHSITPVEERTFVIGGETFIAKDGVHPSVLTGYDRLDEANITQTLQIVDETILAMVEGGEEGGDARARYEAVRARTDDFITLETLSDLAKWLLEVQTGRPTGQPSGSAPGRPSTATRSTGGSSSRATRPALVN